MRGSETPDRRSPVIGGVGPVEAPDVPRMVWRSAPVRYGIAVLAIAAVALIQRLTVPQQDLAPFVLFFAGIGHRVGIRRPWAGPARGPAGGRDGQLFLHSGLLVNSHCIGSALIATCLSLVSGVVVSIFCGALRKSLG